MRRTVKGTKFTYAKSEMVNGEIKTEIRSIVVNEKDPKKAYREAVKTLGHNFDPIATEEVEKLYILDDVIFFQYAKEADHKEVKPDNAE